ncbi:T9SS type A sorting domain-containing protein, partial [bacterium]|nr:T9SS type A sorting domain-containing protein [bacterium]
LSIAIDGSGNKWIGTYSDGLAKFDGTNWTVYNSDNSDLPGNRVFSITIDGNSTKWIGTYTGVAAFNESGIPSDVKENILSNYNVSVFPNPASDYLHIDQSEENISHIEIINLQGQVIKTQRILGNQSTLNLTTVSAGVYILKIYTNSGFVVKKLIKQ